MNALQITLRLVHILGGIFWVGSMVFNAVFLFPAIRDAGPDGGKVAAGVMKRGFPVITPIVAILVMLSGLWMYSRASMGFDKVYMSSPVGMAFGTGAVFAILAFLVGMIVTRPAMMNAMALRQAAAQAAPAERDAKMAEAQAQQVRATGSGNVVAILLVCAAAAMAVARYV